MPESNRWYSWLITIPALYRYMITVALSGGMILGIYFGLFDIAGAILARRMNEAEELCVQCKSSGAAKRHSKRLSRQITQLKETLSRYTSDGEEGSVDAVTAFTIPRPAGGQLRDCTTSYTIDKEWYVKRGLRAHLSGTLSEIIAFIRAACKENGLMRCRDVVATQSTPDNYEADILLESLSIRAS